MVNKCILNYEVFHIFGQSVSWNLEEKRSAQNFEELHS